MPFNSKWNSLVPKTSTGWEVGGVDPYSIVFNGSLLPIYNKNPKPSDLVFKPPAVSHLSSHPFVVPSFTHPCLSHRTQGQNEHAQVHLDNVSTEDLAWLLLAKSGPGRFFGTLVKIPSLTSCWKQNGKSDCPVSWPACNIRLLHCLTSWPTPEPPQQEFCNLLPFLVIDYDLGLSAYVRNAQLGKRVSRFDLCLVLWVGQNPVPKVQPWRARAEHTITFLQRIILSRLIWEKNTLETFTHWEKKA